MSPSNKPSLVPKVLTYFDIEYHVALDLLIPRWNVLNVLFPNLEGRSYIPHFVAYCFPPFSWSRCLASSTDLRIQIPNLWVLSQYFDLTFDMIRFLFFNVYGTHQAKAGSMAIFAAAAYSAVCTGYASLRSFSDTQFVLPSFHCARSSHQMVVSRLLLLPSPVVMNASWSFTS